MRNANQVDPAELENLRPADQVDLICDDFEQAWLNGDSPQIENFLDRIDPAAREKLLGELLLVDREFRIKQGKSASRDTYLDRFPAYSTVIEKLEFATIDERQSGNRPLTPLTQSVRHTGDKIAHFELMEELGAGASGSVWKALDTELRRMVAIKIPRYERLSGQERDRFLREGRACAQLRHPNIVTVYEVGEQHGRAFIVSELIEGIDLRNKRLTPRAAAELAAEIAEGLHHAHEHGVIHRDLKPGNIIIDRDGHPHIADFGLAKWTTASTELTLDGNILGTPAYMSPEQARGESSSADPRSDVYGLGALIYEMLTNQPPFAGDVSAIVHQVIHDEPAQPRKLNAAIPRDLETICVKAMSKDPRRRYPSALEMAADLRRFLHDEPISARRTSPAEKGLRWMRRRRAILAACALALVAACSLAMANRYSAKNRELLAIRPISISTNPPGAQITFVRLSPTTGQPISGEIHRAGHRSPLTEDLSPGDYLVVAVLDDGRFHEVYRHVPEDPTAIPGAWRHLFWKLGPDGHVLLPTIMIPPADVSRGMLRINRSSNSPGIASSANGPDSGFFIDAREFTYGDFKLHISDGHWPPPLNKHPPDELAPMSVDYERAMSYAEEMGKRLPTIAEFKAANNYLFRSPANQVDTLGRGPHAIDESEAMNWALASAFFYPTQLVERIATVRAEWTSTWPLTDTRPGESAILKEFAPIQQLRFVYSSTSPYAGTKPGGSAAVPIPSTRLVSRATVSPTIGFRCVRSVQPQY